MTQQELYKLSDKEYFEYLESKGHSLKREDDGTVDIWAFDEDYHNGIMCIKCYDSWCYHCRDSAIDCECS